MSFSRSSTLILFQYSLNQCALNRVSSFRDLGVNMVSTLSFNDHIEASCRSAMSTLVLIRRICKDFNDVNWLKCLYFSLVRSPLEYACVVWNPVSSSWTARIEKIQCCFSRVALRLMIPYSRSPLPSYADRCLLVGLESLEIRRKWAQAICIASLILGNTDAPVLLSMVPFYAPSRNHTTSSLSL